MRADRLLAIMLMLQTEGKMTAQKLADKLEVSRRTILRDIDALSMAGVPVYAEGGHGGGIALDEQYRTTLAAMQDKEISTLFVGSNFQLLNEIGLGDAAESTMLKLQAVLPTVHQPSVEHFRQRILIDPMWWWHDAQPLPWWDQLQQAVYENRHIQVIYQRHDGRVVERILEPYSLVAKSSIWYLIANHAGELHTYRVLRFHEIVLLDTTFQRREDFDLPNHWQAQMQQFGKLVSDYTFTLRMDPAQMNFIKTIVPGRYQQIEQSEADGWITMQFHLESVELARMLVFGLGEHAAVVEPQELKEAVISTAQAVLSKAAR
jgi:predicted DNA-binding transcriptional regulator YafY